MPELREWPMARGKREVNGLMDTKMLEVKGLGDPLHTRVEEKHVNGGFRRAPVGRCFETEPRGSGTRGETVQGEPAEPLASGASRTSRALGLTVQ